MRMLVTVMIGAAALAGLNACDGHDRSQLQHDAGVVGADLKADARKVGASIDVKKAEAEAKKAAAEAGHAIKSTAHEAAGAAHHTADEAKHAVDKKS